MSRSPSPDSPPAARDDEEKDAREKSDSPKSSTDGPKSPSESPKSNRSQESSRKASRESEKRRDSHEDEKMPLTPPNNRSRAASPQHRRHRESRSSSPSRSRSRSHRSHSRSQNRRSRSRSRDRRSHSRSRDRRSRSRSRDRRSPARRRSPVRTKSPAQAPKPTEEPEKKKNDPKDLLRTRTGGAYIPPAKLRLMQQQITDKSSEQYQRMNWERMKKKIHGLVNRVNAKNLVQIVRELLQENVIRSKGLLCRDIIAAQAFSPGFSNVYAALVAVINSKFPHIGELLLRRLIVQFKRSFRRNDRGVTVNVIKFIAHLINQQVAHEVLALEIMILMLEEPTDDSVEVAIAFLKECGAKLMEIAPAALNSVYDRLRAILMETERSENALDRRIQYMIETAMQIRKDKFAAYPAVVEDLDLIEEEDQIIHTLNLEDAVDPENGLNVFKLDPEFEKNENNYEEIRKEIIGDADISSDEEEEAEDDDEESEAEEAPKKTTEIIDNTDQNLTAFRREVYLTLQSSLDYQEAAHKLLKMKIPDNLQNELCAMLVDCCAQQRTYERFYGMLIERFCRLRLEYQQCFEKLCQDTYATVHRIDITKLRNLARLVAHLLSTDAIEWKILADVKMTEEDTTSAGRIYIKFIFMELVEAMGMVKLHTRVTDPTLAHCFVGMFPRTDPQDARFAINFFTMIGLGGLTLELREWLNKGLKKKKGIMDELKAAQSSSDSSSDSSDSDSSDSSDSSGSSDSSDSSSSSSSDSSEEPPKKKKKSGTVLKKKETDTNDHKEARGDSRAERRKDEEKVKRRSDEGRRDRSAENREPRRGRDRRDSGDGRHDRARRDRSKEKEDRGDKRRQRQDSVEDDRRERKDRDRRDRSEDRDNRRDRKERSRSRDCRDRRDRSRSRERTEKRRHDDDRRREEKVGSDDRRRRH